MMVDWGVGWPALSFLFPFSFDVSGLRNDGGRFFVLYDLR